MDDAPAIERHASAPNQTRRRPRGEPPADGAVRAKLPQRQAPQLASVADKPPDGKGWVSEIKFDGYRLLCWLEHGKARVMTRGFRQMTTGVTPGLRFTLVKARETFDGPAGAGAPRPRPAGAPNA